MIEKVFLRLKFSQFNQYFKGERAWKAVGYSLSNNTTTEDFP
jgi:hypothetical protein